MSSHLLRFESPEDGTDASFVAPANKDGKAQLRAMRAWFKEGGCTTLVTRMSHGKDKYLCLVVQFPEAKEEEEDELESSDDEEEKKD